MSTGGKWDPIDLSTAVEGAKGGTLILTAPHGRLDEGTDMTIEIKVRVRDEHGKDVDLGREDLLSLLRFVLR